MRGKVCAFSSFCWDSALWFSLAAPKELQFRITLLDEPVTKARDKVHYKNEIDNKLIRTSSMCLMFALLDCLFSKEIHTTEIKKTSY